MSGKEDTLTDKVPLWRDALFRFGTVVTVCWIAAAGCLMLFVSSRDAALKPNEWGDMFAGLFAPVAFLWLVLGFLQQGKELRLSTHALKLQAQELRNAVEHQHELAVASQKSVEISKATLLRTQRASVVPAAYTWNRVLDSYTNRKIQGFALNVRWKNVGPTTAMNVSQNVVYELQDSRSFARTSFENVKMRAGPILGPDGEFSSKTTVAMSELVRLWEKEARLFILARVEYDDIFGFRHHHQQAGEVQLFADPRTTTDEDKLNFFQMSPWHEHRSVD